MLSPIINATHKYCIMGTRCQLEACRLCLALNLFFPFLDIQHHSCATIRLTEMLFSKQMQILDRGVRSEDRSILDRGIRSEEGHESQAQIVTDLVIASFFVELSFHNCHFCLYRTAGQSSPSHSWISIARTTPGEQ